MRKVKTGHFPSLPCWYLVWHDRAGLARGPPTRPPSSQAHRRPCGQVATGRHKPVEREPVRNDPPLGARGFTHGSLGSQR